MYFIGSLSKQSHMLLKEQAMQKGTSVMALSGLIVTEYLSGNLKPAPQSRLNRILIAQSTTKPLD